MSRSLSIIGLFLTCLAAVSGQQKPDKKDGPHVVVCVPIAVTPEHPIKITIRGARLDTATEVRFLEPKSHARIVAKGKDNLPNGQDANLVGDSHIDVEITLPPDTPSGKVPFVVVTPAGESQAHALLVERDVSAITEKEPNNGFRQAQLIQLPQTIDGAIGQPQDVDVFRFDGEEGQRIVCEVFAARYGSPLDSILTLYDSDGHEIAANDDSEGSPDSRLEVVLPKSGVFYLSLIDAHDQGGPAFVYRLKVRGK